MSIELPSLRRQVVSLTLLVLVAVFAVLARVLPIGNDPEQAIRFRRVCAGDASGGAIYRSTYRWKIFGLLPTHLNQYLIRTSAAAWLLLDAGVPEPVSYTQQLIRKIRATTAREGGELRLLLLTHGHWDHSGGAPALLEAFPQLEIVLHEEERAFVTGEKPYGEQRHSNRINGLMHSYVLPPAGPMRLGIPASKFFYLQGEEGDVAEAAALSPAPRHAPPRGVLTYIRTPGHNHGHLSYVHAPSGTLFPGDTLSADGLEGYIPVELKSAPGFFHANLTQLRQDVRRLAALEGVRLSLSGHDATGNGSAFREVQAYARTLRG